jgi:hypothetical protein
MYRERVRRAAEIPLERKILSGAALFDLGCRLMESGIRAGHPDADAAAVSAMLQRRMEIARRLEMAE